MVDELPADDKPLPWDRRIAVIEGALRRLPIAPPSDPNAIPYAETIPMIARDLALLGSMGEPPPSAAPISAKAVTRELRDIRRLTRALRATLEGAHAQTIATLGFNKPWPIGAGGLLTQLRLLETASRTPRVADGIPEVGDGPHINKGRRPAVTPSRVALLAAEHFARLTGKPPARQNRMGDAPFVALLGDVFAALGLKANSEHYARGVTEEYRQKNTNSLL